MVRVKGYAKNIACLESFWDYNIEKRLSVAPMLEILERRNGTRSVFLTCNTTEELKFNLDILKRANGYDILFLAFHGYPGGIYLPDLEIEMESLAKFMGRSFRNRIVFFDSCRTLAVKKDRVMDFISMTGVTLVMGFKREVDWLDGAAIDLLVLNRLQFYKDMGRFWSRFRRAYKDLVRITGMVVYHK